MFLDKPDFIAVTVFMDYLTADKYTHRASRKFEFGVRKICQNTRKLTIKWKIEMYMKAENTTEVKPK